MATEFDTLQNDQNIIEHLTGIIRDEDVDEVIVGQPLRSQGEPGTAHQAILSLIHDLHVAVPELQIKTVDEAFTTHQAKLELEQQGASPLDISKRIDQYAAKILLDQYNREHPISLQ